MTEPTNIEETQYLTFKLDDEIFAVDVAKVREILDFMPATKIPGTPSFMLGIINVRGNVMPVVDMRMKFGLSAADKTVDTCIIVMEVVVEGEVTVLGALVDSVREVFELASDKVEPPPRIGMRWKSGFLQGIGKRNDLLLIVLDIDKVFSCSELAMLQDIEGEKPSSSTEMAINAISQTGC